MKVKQRSETRLVLAGIPGTGRWMVFAIAVGITVASFSAYLAWRLWSKEGFGLTLAPLSVGVLIGAVIGFVGLIQVFARERLTLDRQTGEGSYDSNSPLVTTPKPFRFKLADVHAVTVSTQKLDRPTGAGDPGWSEAKQCSAALRIAKPRRSVVLDETQNGRVDRVNRIAREVAAFLGTELTTENHLRSVSE